VFGKYKPWNAFLCCLLAIPTCAYMLEGIQVSSMTEALMAGALLGVAHLFVRPLLRILSAPIGCITLGLFGFVIDVGLLYGCTYFVPGFQILNIWHAVLAAFLVNSTCLIAAGRK
jgi:putative membrane protein